MKEITFGHVAGEVCFTALEEPDLVKFLESRREWLALDPERHERLARELLATFDIFAK